MMPLTIRRACRLLAFWTGALLVGLSGPSAKADGLYTITDLGTLSGQSSSVATSINNQGQVVGVSYNSSDGYFASGIAGPSAPPRFAQTGNGAQSFLYSNGQMTTINPTGGLATSINNSGQVVGGPYSSINDSGQYVGSAFSGVYNTNYSNTAELVSGGTTTALPVAPYSINASGQIAGWIYIPNEGNFPAVYQSGQTTNLISTIGYYLYNHNAYVDAGAIAINAKGDMLINVWQPGSAVQSYHYIASDQFSALLPTPSGGGTFVGAALNNEGQIVGGGYIDSDGTLKLLTSLLNGNSGWTDLNATGINDLGQIVGQGTYNGQQVAFLMTPDAIETPEPATVAMWGLVVAASVGYRVRSRGRRAMLPIG
jgi:probable HAF family extracellular repeat protein